LSLYCSENSGKRVVDSACAATSRDHDVYNVLERAWLLCCYKVDIWRVRRPLHPTLCSAQNSARLPATYPPV